MFLGSAERIMYTEMVLPNKLLSLCEGIRIARIKKDYLQEEQLYYVLIDLMRSPEMIKKSSGLFFSNCKYCATLFPASFMAMIFLKSWASLKVVVGNIFDDVLPGTL